MAIVVANKLKKIRKETNRIPYSYRYFYLLFFFFLHWWQNSQLEEVHVPVTKSVKLISLNSEKGKKKVKFRVNNSDRSGWVGLLFDLPGIQVDFVFLFWTFIFFLYRNGEFGVIPGGDQFQIINNL